MREPYITIFTPTYNRKNLLCRLYQSLCSQEAMNYEWIIVDDGSSDGTEELVRGWSGASAAPFEIRYYKQEHGGKHRALNKGFLLARGIYFFIVDSDDYLTADATKVIEKWGKTAEAQEGIAGVSGLRISDSGILGGRPVMPEHADYVEASNFERAKYNLWGDKAEVYKTSILRKYPFPEFDGEYFVTESVCWDAIAAAGYKLRWYDYPIYHCEYLEGGLTKSGANSMEGHAKNYRGYCYRIKKGMQRNPFETKCGLMKDYLKTSVYMKKGFAESARDLDMSLAQYAANLFVVAPLSYVYRQILKVIRK